jgi:hypothetical protein
MRSAKKSTLLACKIAFLLPLKHSRSTVVAQCLKRIMCVTDCAKKRQCSLLPKPRGMQPILSQRTASEGNEAEETESSLLQYAKVLTKQEEEQCVE